MDVSSPPSSLTAPELQKIMATSSFRLLATRKERALVLKNTYNVKPSVICSLLGLHKGTLSKWIASPDTPEGRGRPSYLNRNDYDRLFNEIVPERTANHMSMTAEEIVYEVIDVCLS